MTDEITQDVIVKPIEIVNGRSFRVIRNTNSGIYLMDGQEMGADGDILVSIVDPQQVLRRRVRIVSDSTDIKMHFEDITDEDRN